jgi:hypothetical protein
MAYASTSLSRHRVTPGLVLVASRLDRCWAWLTAGQFTDVLVGRRCVNAGIVYVHPLSVKSNSPEGPLRRVPFRHTVYFLYRAPYYAVAERWRELPFYRAGC